VNTPTIHAPKGNHMQVETYEVNEVNAVGEVEKFDEQAIALIEKLGLTGQSGLVSPVASGAREVQPYNAMTEQEQQVYRLHFPIATPVETYDAGPIPIRALQVIAYARDFFPKLEVWHKQSGAITEDPVLVGMRTHPQHKFLQIPHLLARWGDALKPFSALVVEAAVIARERLAMTFAKARRESESDAAEVAACSDNYALAWLRNGPAYHPSRPRE
jgi:hypothetical protein